MATDLEAVSIKTRAWLLGRAEHLCGARADAEDLVQETYTRFWTTFSGASRLPGESKCASWLVSTMTNCFYDQLRRQRVRERCAVDPALAPEREVTPEALGRSLSARASDRISSEHLDGSIRSLSPALRDAIMMSLGGWRNREIARRLGISPGAVAKRLYDGRVKLRERLESLLPVGGR